MNNIDVPKIYEAFCALPPSEQKPGNYIANVRILYNEKTSIVLGDKKRVVKIIPRDDALAEIEKEFKMLTLCRDIRGGAFVTPKPIAFGNNPNHLVMTRLEKPYGYAPMVWDYQRTGRAIGEFAAELWVRYGYIHDDIRSHNFTPERDGKVGVLDFESIKEPITRVGYNFNGRKSLEEMFLTPLRCKPNLSPDIADGFTARSGIPINYAWLNRLINDYSRYIMVEWMPEDRDEAEDIIESNLLEWNEHLTNHRPVDERRLSCTAPASRL